MVITAINFYISGPFLFCHVFIKFKSWEILIAVTYLFYVIFQSMAGKFQTTTTPTSTYYSQTQQSHAAAGAQPSITPSSSYSATPPSSAAAATHKSEEIF